MDCASYHLSQVTPQFTWGSLHEGNWSISMCVLCRRWRRSSPGSCRNRKCSSRWAASRSALIPPPRPASPSSIRSPASSPPASRGHDVCTHTDKRTDAPTETVKTEPCCLWPLTSDRLFLCFLSGSIWRRVCVKCSVQPSWSIFLNSAVPAECLHLNSISSQFYLLLDVFPI